MISNDSANCRAKHLKAHLEYLCNISLTKFNSFYSLENIFQNEFYIKSKINESISLDPLYREEKFKLVLLPLFQFQILSSYMEKTGGWCW